MRNITATILAAGLLIASVVAPSRLAKQGSRTPGQIT